MKATPSQHRFNLVLETLTIAAVYWVLARLGQFVAIPPGNVTPVWPASGFALAVVLLRGYRTWVGLWIGVAMATVWPFLDTSSLGDGLRTMATGIAAGPGAILQAFAGSYLIQRFCEKRNPFGRTRDVFLFTGTQAIACFSSATLGVLAMCLGQVLPWSSLGYTWLTWYFGDAVGVLLVAPFLLSWHDILDTTRQFVRRLELTLILSLGIVATLIAFGNFFEVPLAFVPIPLVLWAAVRGGPFEVSGTVLAVTAVAIYRTSTGHGPFVSEDPNASLLSLQVFTTTTAIAGLAVSAALSEHQIAEDGLRDTMHELRESETRYRELFENANDLIFMVTLDGKFTSLNKTAEDTCGFSRHELLGEDISILVPPEYAHKVRAMIDRKITTREGTTYEIEIATKSGERVPVEISSRIMLENGKPVGTQGIARNISDRKRAERAIAEVVSGLTLPPRANTATELAVHLDDLTLKALNLSGTAIRGMSINAASKQEFAETVVKFFYDKFVNHQGQRELALVQCFETRKFEDLNEELKTLATSSSAPTSDTTCMTLVAAAGDRQDWNDIRHSTGHPVIALTKDAGAEQSHMVLQLARQLGAPFEANGQRDFKILLNEPTKKVFHIADAQGSSLVPLEDELITRFGIKSVVGFGDVLPNGELFVIIIYSKVPISYETAVLFSHLSISIRIALLPFVQFDHKIEAQIIAVDELLRNQEEIVARQESQLRVALQELNQANVELERSNMELQQFACSASHDLQEPLRSIAGFCELLQRRYIGQLDREAEELIGYAVSGAKRMRTLIEDLLVYSQVDAQGSLFQPIDLSDVVDEAVRSLAVSIEESGAQVTRDALPTVVGDRSQLLQLAQNLIGNGIKYHGDRECHVHVSAQSSGREWTVAVRDNGIGIPADKLDTVFEMFRRLHTREEYPGTGIGLATCRRIVERHGGKIWAESVLGDGSTFCFALRNAAVAQENG